MFKYLDSASTFTFANSIFLFIVSEFVNLFINSITFSLLSDTHIIKLNATFSFAFILTVFFIATIGSVVSPIFLPSGIELSTVFGSPIASLP